MKTAQLGIELGTRHLRICTRDKEEFLKIKNMIAFDEDAKLKAFGNEAFAMYEKQPYSIHVVKPMEHGKKQRIKNTGGKAKDTGEELTDKRTADSGCHAGWNDLTGRSESFLSTD